MRLVEINWRPTSRQLRQFGFVALVALPLMAWLWRFTEPVFWGFAGVAGFAGVLALLAPQSLRWPFLLLSIVALPFGLVVSEVMLAAMFFLVFLPIGLIVRLLSRNEFRQTFDSHAATYWTVKAQASSESSYFRQS